AMRVIRRPKLRRQVLDRDLDGKLGGDRAHVLDAAPRRELRGIGPNVLRVQATREPDDDRGIERLSFLETVNGVPAFLVAAELERRLGGRGRRRDAKGGAKQAR